MDLLTHEASEALHWLTERMPDGIFDRFTVEMEEALRPILTRYGFDRELIDAFAVDKLLGQRKLLPPADDLLQSVQADIYGGDATYAVTGTGRIFRKTQYGEWVRSTLALDDVKATSITKLSSMTIKVKTKDL